MSYITLGKKKALSKRAFLIKSATIKKLLVRMEDFMSF